jgi:hypothetical protein
VVSDRQRLGGGSACDVIRECEDLAEAGEGDNIDVGMVANVVR